MGVISNVYKAIIYIINDNVVCLCVLPYFRTHRRTPMGIKWYGSSPTAIHKETFCAVLRRMSSRIWLSKEDIAPVDSLLKVGEAAGLAGMSLNILKNSSTDGKVITPAMKNFGSRIGPRTRLERM